MAFDKKLKLSDIKTPKDSLTLLTDSVLPGETNALNNLFGGELLARMDRAASISARRHAEEIVVTSSVNNVSFGKSIPIGTTVTIEAKVSRAFTTSMEVFITHIQIRHQSRLFMHTEICETDLRLKTLQSNLHAFTVQ